MLSTAIITVILITGVTTDKVHYVLPSNKLCISLPCRELQYFIDNSKLYFISNTKFFFTEGTYYHVKLNFIVQNIANISFIGMSVTNISSPASIISCLPEHSIKFYNVQSITINNLMFKGCGNIETMPYSSAIVLPNEYQTNYWASIFLIACINVKISNVQVDNPIGYGIVCSNMIGNNILKNITIIMRRKILYNLLLNTCSNGINVIYYGNKEGPASHVTISSVVLIQKNLDFNQCYGNGMIAISLKQVKFSVFLTISHSVFYQLNGNIVKITVASFANNSIHFNKCRFINATVLHSIPKPYAYIIDVSYKFICDTRVTIIFSHCNFMYTNLHNSDDASVILHFELVEKHKYCLPQYDNMLIYFNNMTFYQNAITLLQVWSALPNFVNKSTVMTIIATGNFIVQGNNNHNKLILLHYTKFYFTGISIFSKNIHSDIIYSHSSKLIFSNYTLFYRNEYCSQLISLTGKWQYILLNDHAKLKITSNKVYNEVITVAKTYNHPFRHCLFQFNSTTQNNFNNFIISISANFEEGVNSKRNNSTLNELSSHCKWINETAKAFQSVDNSALYNKIITYEGKLGTHTTICYCQQFPHYNCSVDELGPIYPGQTLTIDFCLPYNNENIGLLYAETYNDNLPITACKVTDQDNIKHSFIGNQSKSINFTIASNSQTRCELFLTAQPNLYTHYDAFYIKLLPCPLGFAFQNGVCDCDPLLNLYTEKCIIHDQTVKRLPNHWITGNTSNNSTKYLVSASCPSEYCSHDLMVNVHRPDTQCQQHRTGPLCSHCTDDYSEVFGSSKCKKCTNAHLVFILLILFNGILLVVILFISNLTVTTGTINGIILYVNIIEMNNHYFNSQDKLVSPLVLYLIITNLGSCFEMCFYNGMDIYVKKWMQLFYPTYLAFIAIIFIIASRYSGRLYRLTHNRSLPVLATLFMLSYTGILKIISSVFLYTTIISLPSNIPHIVWSLYPNIPLWKLLFLIIVCVVLFMFLLMFNVILLFTKPLMRFKIIHQFKPMIDAFQGPFKHHCYYWIGLQLLLRNVLFLLSALVKDLGIDIGCIIIVVISIIHSYIQPYKSKVINFQEVLLLFNYTILCIFSFSGSELQGVIILNILVGISLVHFLSIVVYHMFAFICHTKLCNNVKWCNKVRSVTNNVELQELAVNFQEPLLGQD